jgi:protein MpaA
MKFIELTSGTSVKGGIIRAYKSEKKNPEANTKYNYILGAVHGDEVEGAHLAQELFKWLSKTDEVDMPIIIVPIVNVDGFKLKTRVNGNGVDLNRNLPSTQWTPEAREAKYFPGVAPLSEPENQYLVSLFEKYPPRFILSFHSWYPVINYNGACKELADFLASFNKYPIEADFLTHPTPGSLGEYGPQVLGAPVLTFECPVLSDNVTLDTIWKENEEGFKKLFTTKIIETFKS